MSKIIALIAVIVTAAVFTGGALASAAGGEVTYSDGITPVGGAYVQIINDNTMAQGSTYADGSGYYVFGGLTPGNYYSVHASYVSGCEEWATGGSNPNAGWFEFQAQSPNGPSNFNIAMTDPWYWC